MKINFSGNPDNNVAYVRKPMSDIRQLLSCQSSQETDSILFRKQAFFGKSIISAISPSATGPRVKK
jgi:hypothetical protein